MKTLIAKRGLFMSAPESIFKTPALEKQYFTIYETLLAMWPSPYESLEIPTSFGSTHVNACGDKAKPPMILLPGFGANSTMFFPNVTALSYQFRIYAVDTIGQPGKSLPSQNLTTKNSNDWIVEVLDGLGLKKAHFVGISLGAWLALNFSIHKAERVDHLALLDPAASFEKMSAAFMWHSLIPIMVLPTRRGLIRFFRWMTGEYVVNKNWGELMVLGILNTHSMPPIRATVFSDEDLHHLQTPTLLLIGENSVIYNPERVYHRAKQLIPDIKAEIISNTGHSLLAEKSEIVNSRILQFCQ
jgi:pimeloyl-ACP methyl ester carboxylesterase